MTTYTEILCKILANQIQQYIKRIIEQPCGFYHRNAYWFKSKNQLMLCTDLIEYMTEHTHTHTHTHTNTQNHPIDTNKSICPNQTVMTRNPQLTRNRREFLQTDKQHPLKKPHSRGSCCGSVVLEPNRVSMRIWV